jgi:hypothetical protein
LVDFISYENLGNFGPIPPIPARITNPLAELWIAALLIAVGYPRGIDWTTWPDEYRSPWRA